MNTHTSYFTFSVAEVVQAVGEGVGRKEKGGQGSSQGFGPEDLKERTTHSWEKVLWKVGGYPLLGFHLSRRFKKKLNKEGRERRAFLSLPISLRRGGFQIEKSLKEGREVFLLHKEASQIEGHLK